MVKKAARRLALGAAAVVRLALGVAAVVRRLALGVALAQVHLALATALAQAQQKRIAAHRRTVVVAAAYRQVGLTVKLTESLYRGA